MKTSSLSVKTARAVHRALLVLVARDVRRAYRADMQATFHAASEEAGRRGMFAVWRLLAREVADLALSRRANRLAELGLPARAADARGGEWIQGSAWEQAWRSLSRRPAFFAAAVLTLGVGAGVTTAVFSLIDTVLIKPLPYPDADRLVAIYESSSSAREKTSLVAPGRLEDWNRLNRSFVALSGSYAENVTDTSGAEPERLEGRRVTQRFFTVYGQQPIAGRPFTDEEEAPGGPGAVVISERFWSRRFQQDPAAVGRALVIGGRSYQIVGVMPASFTSAATDAWLPAQIDPGLLAARQARFLNGIGRLRPGVELQAGAQDLIAVQQALGKEFPATDAGWSVEMRALKDLRVGTSRRGLLLIFGAVAALWTIAVANIAGLTLVQVRRRSRELAIRAALGASRARVVGTVTREGLLIALAGGTLGGLLAAWFISAMPAVLATTPRINELGLDWRVAAFVAGTSLLAACIFSFLPALAGTRPEVTRAIAEGSRGVAGGRHLLQKGLVVGQVALSVLLVGSATLLLRSYYNLTHVETGFDASGVLTFHVAARWDEDRTRVAQLQVELLRSLEQLPHVQAAGLTNFLPASGATLRYQVKTDGVTGSNADGSATVGTRMIGAGYLRAIRAHLVSGSWCPDLTADFKAPLNAMVNQRFVEVNAPGQNLVGRTLRMTEWNSGFTITGVVSDLAEDGHAMSPVPYVYTCNAAGAWPDPEYVVRTTDRAALATDLRRIVREIDPARAIFGLRPLQDVIDAALDQPRLDATLLGLFAGAAVTLAGIGLYSLFMLVVSDRAREMAVRLAIGAAPRQVVQLVMSGAGRLLVGGLVLGVALTAAADRLLRGVLFGVSPLDAAALAASAVTLALVSVIAVAGPAIRAARIAPIDALRGE
jgi:predicted permease